MVESTSTQSLKIENVDISTAQGALHAVSESGLADTDLAEEISNLQQGLLRFETSIRSLASQLQNEQSRSRLLDFTI